MTLWLKRGLVATLLWPLSRLFGLAVFLRRYAYDKKWMKSVRLPVPVIVVGNVFVGGTGKTPLVVWLVEGLRKAGFYPGVVSRGYGAFRDEPAEVTPLSDPAQVGDEPLLIARKAQCPLVVCRKRTKAGQFLLATHPEVNVIVSDDGLQHYALQRDVEILLFDGRGAGNGWMLPAGPLREPVSRKRDFTVVNGSNYPAPGNPIWVPDLYLMKMKIDQAEKLNDRTRRKALATLSGKIVAAAGIGNPGRFFAALRAHRMIFDEMPLPDHFDFSANPFEKIQADVILITEKDAVKCARKEELITDERIWVGPATVEIDRSELEMRIVEKCGGCKTT